MAITLDTLKQSTEQTRNFSDLRQYPLAIRNYLVGRKGTFDPIYNNRKTDTFLQRFRAVKYPVTDRDYGSMNADLCNIWLNLFNDKEINKLIDTYLFERKWQYHPVRKFEKWHTIARLHYNNEAYFWILLVFNRIVDPFKGLEDFNIIRVPQLQFLYDLPYSLSFDFTAAQF